MIESTNRFIRVAGTQTTRTPVQFSNKVVRHSLAYLPSVQKWFAVLLRKNLPVTDPPPCKRRFSIDFLVSEFQIF